MRFLVFTFLLCGFSVYAQNTTIQTLTPNLESADLAMVEVSNVDMPATIKRISTQASKTSVNTEPSILANPVAMKRAATTSNLPSVDSIMKSAKLPESKRAALKSFLSNYQDAPMSESTIAKSANGEMNSTSQRFESALGQFLGAEHADTLRRSHQR